MPASDELTLIDLRERGFLHAFVVGHHAHGCTIRAMPHYHPGIFELHLVVSGKITYLIDNNNLTIQAGQALLIQPDIVHGSADEPIMKCERYWLQIRRPAEGSSLLGLSVEATTELISKLDQSPTHTLAGAAELAPTFHKLISAAKGRSTGILQHENLRNLMLRLLLDYLALAEHSASKDKHPSIQNAIKRIEQENGLISVEDLISASRMSTSTFHQRFREHTGLSPTDFAMRLRIDIARQLLISTDRPVTDISAELNFSSSQHFATAFRRYTGMTPSAYRMSSVFKKPQKPPVIVSDPSIKPLG